METEIDTLKNRKFAFTQKGNIMETIVNKVAQSGIITLDLEHLVPSDQEIMSFDIKPFLFKELILREKDFRTAMAAFDWSVFEGKVIAVYCSADAIIPMWAYMLIATFLEPYSLSIYFGNIEEVKKTVLLEKIKEMDLSAYEDKRMVIKGCSDFVLPEAAYMYITQRLKPMVKSLMYGEPCSTVPIYKQKK